MWQAANQPGCNDLSNDLGDGAKLGRLIECLSAEKDGVDKGVQLKLKEAKEVGNTALRLDNLTLCFEEMSRIGVNLKGVNPKDVMDGDTKLVVILIKNLMQWAGDEATVRQISTTQTAGAGVKARERWASQVRSIEETRRLQLQKAQETRQRLFEGIARTMESRKATWNEAAMQKSLSASGHMPSDALNAKSLITQRVAQAPPAAYSEVTEPLKEEDMWDVVDGGDDGDDFTFTTEPPPEEAIPLTLTRGKDNPNPDTHPRKR